MPGVKRSASTKWGTRKKRKLAPKGRKKTAPKRKYTRKTKTAVKSAGSYGKSASKFLSTPSKKFSFLREALKLVPQQVKMYDSQLSAITTQGSQLFQNIVDCMQDARLSTFVADSTAYEKHVWVEGITTNTTIWNMTTEIVARITIYDWVAKEDVPTGLTVEAAIANGLAAKYNTTNPGLVPYVHPNESLEFARYFKIVKTTDIVLAPNENHVHKHTQILNKMYSNIYQTNISDPVYLKGFSSGVCVRILGGCVGGTSTGAGTHQLTYGAVRVGFLTQYKDYCRFPQGSSTSQVVASVGTMALSDIGTPKVPVIFTDTLLTPDNTM